MDDPRRNIYSNDVDFEVLALQDKEFAKYLKTNGQMDFTDPDAVRQLTKSLLKRDFGLEVDLPEDRLCPPVPNRLNYVLWIQDLVDCTTDEYSHGLSNTHREVVGLDIGTGASCIYPLLACTTRPTWRMAATELDEKNVHYARRNVDMNGLADRIDIVAVEKADDPLIPLDNLRFDSADFTMCNPPFYESKEEMIESAKSKSRPPFSACTGAKVEMVTPGGEVAFVSRMIEESVKLGPRIRWFTSMLGKLSSVVTLIEKLKDVGISNYAVTELVQGKTRRWAIGWSWQDWRPTTKIARGIKSISKNLLAFTPEFTFYPSFDSISDLVNAIQSEIESLGLMFNWDSVGLRGVGFAAENVWSRHARRKRMQGAPAGPALSSPSDAQLGFSIQVRVRELTNAEVVVRWIKGNDQALFESFCGALKRKVEAAGVKTEGPKEKKQRTGE
ncbi:hypothetical protein VTO42DRAFT_8887 [Malbranchea cinnamomea]